MLINPGLQASNPLIAYLGVATRPVHNYHLFPLEPRLMAGAPTSYDWGEHSLHKAASEGDTSTLQQLLKEGHSPSTTGGTTCWLRGASEIHTRTPLHYAAKHGHLDCIRLLLKYGADPNSRDGDGYTPLHYLCQVYKPGRDRHDNLHQCVSSLVLCGANIRAKTNSGKTPLEIAETQRNTICQEAIQKQCALVPTLLVLSRSYVSSLVHSGTLPPPEQLDIPYSLVGYLRYEDVFSWWKIN